MMRLDLYIGFRGRFTEVKMLEDLAFISFPFDISHNRQGRGAPGEAPKSPMPEARIPDMWFLEKFDWSLAICR